MQKTCGVCGGEARPYWQKLHFFKCTRCGYLFRDPCPTPEELSKMYDSSWEAPETNRKNTGGTNMNLSRLCAHRLADSLGVRDFSGLRLLDFGAGKGEMMRTLSDMKAQVYGVEPFGFDFLKSQGLNVFHSLNDIPPTLRFHGILTSDVIEHLRTPWHEIGQLRDLLVDNGWIYLSTPNANGLSAKLRKERWKEASRAGHLVFFTSASLKKTLERSGYQQCRRLHWFVQYKKNLWKRTVQFFLQSVSLDGELRYLAYK